MKPKTLILYAALVVMFRPILAAAPTYISKEHFSVLERWLQSRSDLRLAVDSDCQCDRDLASMRSEGSNSRYQPYYASGDFNDDGQADFAVVVVAKTDASKKLLAVFNAPLTSSTSPAFFDSIDGILVLSRPSAPAKRLLVGRPYSDAATLKPTGSGYSLIWEEP